MAKKNVELKMETLRRMRVIIDECGGVKKIKPNQLRNNKQYIALHKNFMNGFERRISDELITYIYEGKSDDEIKLICKELQDAIVDESAYDEKLKNEKSENLVDEMEHATEEMFVMSKNKVFDGPIVIDTTSIAEGEDVKSEKPQKDKAKRTLKSVDKSINEALSEIKKMARDMSKYASSTDDGGDAMLVELKTIVDRAITILDRGAEEKFELVLDTVIGGVDIAITGLKTRKEVTDALEKYLEKIPNKAMAIGAVGEFIDELVLDQDPIKNEKKIIKKIASAVKNNIEMELSEINSRLKDQIENIKRGLFACKTFSEFNDCMSDIEITRPTFSHSSSEDFLDIMTSIHKKALIKSVGENEARRIFEAGAIDWFRVQKLISNGIFDPLEFAKGKIADILDMFFDRDESGENEEEEENIATDIDDSDEDGDDEPIDVPNNDADEEFPMKGKRSKEIA